MLILTSSTIQCYKSWIGMLKQPNIKTEHKSPHHVKYLVKISTITGIERNVKLNRGDDDIPC